MEIPSEKFGQIWKKLGKSLDRPGDAVRVPDAAQVVEDLLAQGIVAGVPYSRLAPGAGLDDVLLLAATETTTSEDIAALSAALKGRIG